MQSIPQLIELFKHFQSSAFIFFTQIEPLILADSIPDSLSKKINNTDFLNLVQDCQNSLQRLDDYINVLHPLMTKEIKRLLKKHKSSSNDRMIPYADFTIDKVPIFERTVQTLNFEQLLEEALKAGNEIKPVKHRSNFSFEGVCPFCGASHEYIYDNNVVDNTCAKSVEILLLLRQLYLMKQVFTVLTVAVNLQNTMTAQAMLSMFVLVKNVPITRRKRSFTRKVVTKSLKLQANSIDSIIITVISSLI